MKSTPTQTFLLSRAQRIPAISLVFALNKNVSDIYLKLIRLNVVGVFAGWIENNCHPDKIWRPSHSNTVCVALRFGKTVSLSVYLPEYLLRFKIHAAKVWESFYFTSCAAESISSWNAGVCWLLSNKLYNLQVFLWQPNRINRRAHTHKIHIHSIQRQFTSGKYFPCCENWINMPVSYFVCMSPQQKYATAPPKHPGNESGVSANQTACFPLVDCWFAVYIL